MGGLNMNNVNEQKPIDQLANNIHNARFTDIDRETVEFTKIRIIDAVGCLVGGANAAGNAGLIGLIKSWGGKEESTILVHGIKAPVQYVAMANGIMTRSYDFEPVSPMVEGKFWPGHISSTTIPTALTLGEAYALNGKELITALLVGDDIASRALASSGFSFDDGIDNIGTVNAFGSTAIAGRIFGLTPAQIKDALGIVLNQMAGTFQNIWDKTTAFKICSGLSARNGIFAAQLAQAGWNGADDAFFGKYSFYHHFTSGCTDPDILTKNLGKKFYSDGTIKPYCCCRNNHAAIDCALELSRKRHFEFTDIQDVILFVAPDGKRGFCGEPFVLGKFPQANAIWSYRYNVATGLLKGSIGPENYVEQALRDPVVNALAGRIQLEDLPGADLYMARLEVTLRNGEKLTASTQCARGDVDHNPLSRDEILAKFWHNISFSNTIKRPAAQKCLALLEKLEDVENIQQIVELLVVK
jgi:2-methylcitrate dehydratase PrpD